MSELVERAHESARDLREIAGNLKEYPDAEAAAIKAANLLILLAGKLAT